MCLSLRYADWEGRRERMVAATTSNPDVDVYTDRDGRRYVVDGRLPPGDMQYVTRVKPLRGLRLWVEFRDGTSGVADLSEISAASHLAAAPVVGPGILRDGSCTRRRRRLLGRRTLRHEPSRALHAGHRQTFRRSMPTGQIPRLTCPGCPRSMASPSTCITANPICSPTSKPSTPVRR